MIEKLKQFFKPSLPENVDDFEDEEKTARQREIEENMKKWAFVKNALSKAKRIKLDPTLSSDTSHASCEKFFILIEFEMEDDYLQLLMQDENELEEGTLENIEHVNYTFLGEDELKVWFYRKRPFGNYRIYIPYNKSEIS